MKRILLASLFLIPTSAMADCDPAGHFSPYVCPEQNNVPEPDSLLLLGIGGAALAFVRKIKRKR